MKKFIFAVAATLLVSANIAIAEAGDRALNGLIIGGGSGALVGQGIGRNTEATIIGATVGGVLGMIVGNELDRNRGVGYHQRSRVDERHVYHHYPPRGPKYKSHQPRGRFYQESAPRGSHHKKYFRHPPQRICTETVFIREGKYRDKRVVKRECRNSYRPQQHFNRHRPGHGFYR